MSVFEFTIVLYVCLSQCMFSIVFLGPSSYDSMSIFRYLYVYFCMFTSVYVCCVYMKV